MIKKNIPNAITCINVIGGVVAAIFGANPFESAGGLTFYQWAWIFIAISATADFFDGFVARLLHVKSELGKQLDSLCDMVSFGVAPAILIFSMLAHCTRTPAPWWIWGAVLIAVGGALRLAKFNIDTRQTTSFLGLPIPANAIFWIGYSAALANGVQPLASPAVFIPVLLVEVWLMTSEIPLLSLKFQNWKFRDNIPRWLLIAGLPVAIICAGIQGLMWFIIYYFLLSLVFSPARTKAAESDKQEPSH